MSDSSDNTIFLGMYTSFDKRQTKMASKFNQNSLNFTPVNKQNISKLSPDEYSGFLSRSNLSIIENDSLKNDESPLLKRKLKEKDVDLMHAQAKIIRLEDSIKAKEPEQKKKQIFLESELEKYKSQLTAEKNKVDSYKIQLNHLICKDENTQSELNEIKEKYETKCKEYEIKLKNEHKKSKIIQEKLDSTIEKLNKTSDLEKKNAYLESQLTLYLEKLEKTEQKLKSMFEESKEKLNKISSLQIQLEDATHSNKILKNKLAEMEEKVCVEHAFQDDIFKIPEMKKKLASYEEKIKSLEKSHCNSFLLQEKNYNLESQLDREKKKLENLKEITFENEMLHKKLQEWEAIFIDESTKTPFSLSKKIQELQAREALLTEEVGKLKSEIKIKANNQTTLENKISNLENELDKASKQTNDQTLRVKRLQRKLLLVSKERDSFKKILDSYESEITTNISSHDKGRIVALENILAGYKDAFDQYGIEKSTLHASNLESRFKDQSNEDVKRLKDEIIQKDFLIEDLKKRLEGGSYDSSAKVVHISSNPLNKAHIDLSTEIENLRTENSKLLAKLKLAESSNSSLESTDTSYNQPKSSQNVPIDDMKGLNSDLRYTRILAAFKQKSQEFREACYFLTGFKIDSISQNKYKLSHIYAESPNDHLIFERSPKKKMLLLETDYSLTLTDLIDTYLKTHDSIPAFLSSLTLNLFNQQTIVMKQD